ncbi:MAG TPA: MMPL family transporter [Candidatus Binatia bacterium]|nr:MMPL family transporter [Candidatus Binatia bacterium]
MTASTTPPADGWRPLRALVRLASARPRVTVLVSVLAAVASLAYSVGHLGFITSGRDLLPQDQAFVQRDEEYSDDFPRLDQLVVAVESADADRAKAYARRLSEELRREPEIFHHVTYRIDPKRFRGRELLYLDPANLIEVRDKVLDHREFLTAFAARPTLDQLIDGLRTEVVSAFVRSAFDLGLDDDGRQIDLGVARDVLNEIATRVDRPVRYRSPWGSLFALDPTGDAGYFFSDDKRLLFVLVEATRKSGSFTNYREAIGPIRATMARLRAEFPDVKAGLTGAPVLDNDEMEAAFRDSKRATGLAFGLTLLVLGLAFRRRRIPTLVLASLAVSICWSLGVVTLVVGHLSIFSVMFISIVVGLGTDYGVYLLYRHDEERRLGRSPRAALEVTALRSGPGMLSGSLTAAAAFYVLMATDFPGVRELGFIAATSILLAWLAMMTLLPALVLVAGPHHPEPQVPGRSDRVRFVDVVTRHPRLVLGLAATTAVLSTVAARHVHFDYNLLHLQARGTESVAWEERALQSAGRSSFVALSSAGSLDELRERVRAFAALPTVSEVESVLSLIPEDQEAKAKIIGEFAPNVEHVSVAPPGPVELPRLIAALRALRQRLDLAADEAPEGHDRDEVVALRDATSALAAKLEHADPAAAVAAVGHIQYRLRDDFARTLRRLKRNLHPTPIGLADVPPGLRRKFVGQSGRFLVQVQPKVDIWDRAGAEQFVTELRTVDPEVTGTPVITYEAIRYMERAYKEGTLYAFLLVGLLTVLIVGRLREAALATATLALGAVWTIGLMFVFGLEFNLGNVFGLPLILGAGAEFGLNVVLRYRECRAEGGPLLPRSTFAAVLVNGLTTVAGFGSLMVAAHRGIFGLGLLLTLGMVGTLAASLIVLPVLLRWTERPAAA